MRDYVKELGYKPESAETNEHNLRVTVECDACGERVERFGDVMRGHRRRCTVAPANPYTPGVCDC